MEAMSLTFSDDSKTLYSSGWDATIIRWDMDNFQGFPNQREKLHLVSRTSMHT